MPEQSAGNEQRCRAEQVAKALRMFGIATDCGIGDKVRSQQTVSREEISGCLRRSGVHLPPGVSAEFVAGVVQRHLEEVPQKGTAGAPAPEVIRALFLSADPLHNLRLDEEFRECQQKIRGAEHSNRLELVTRPACRADDFLQALNELKPAVLHFSGHGDAQERIFVTDDSGHGAHPITKEALGAVLRPFKETVRLVFLNACYSTAQAKDIVSIVPCAIGMKKPIADAAAIQFAGAFYRAVAFGVSVGNAFEQGKAKLLLENIPEDDRPQLHTMKGVSAGRLFLLQH